MFGYAPVHFGLARAYTFQRCTRLLQRAIDVDPQQKMDESTHASNFRDERIRRSIEDLHLAHEQSDPRTNPAKRRKVSNHSAEPLTKATQQIYDVLQLDHPDDDDVIVFEQAFL